MRWLAIHCTNDAMTPRKDHGQGDHVCHGPERHRGPKSDDSKGNEEVRRERWVGGRFPVDPVEVAVDQRNVSVVVSGLQVLEGQVPPGKLACIEDPPADASQVIEEQAPQKNGDRSDDPFQPHRGARITPQRPQGCPRPQRHAPYITGNSPPPSSVVLLVGQGSSSNSRPLRRWWPGFTLPRPNRPNLEVSYEEPRIGPECRKDEVAAVLGSLAMPPGRTPLPDRNHLRYWPAKNGDRQPVKSGGRRPGIRRSYLGESRPFPDRRQ